ncbi:MAG TPA: hypothetical protein VMV14_08915 [Acidimicrobiales bacterium]|nr:hypothetical protein [Acidimicrobiales bacterium]
MGDNGNLVRHFMERHFAERRRGHLTPGGSPIGQGGRAVALGLMAFAVVVQVAVWGAARTQRGGALWPGLRPVFGVAYGVVLLGVVLLFCARYHLAVAAVWVVVAAAALDGLFWAVRVAGVTYPFGAASSLTAGVGAVVLGAGVLSGKFPGPGRLVVRGRETGRVGEWPEADSPR